jgi:hypothetical protein
MFDDQVVAVDLKLRYHEDLARGQRPMFRSGCSDVGQCEYTRILEKPCVYAEVAADDSQRSGQQDSRIEKQDFVKRFDAAKIDVQKAVQDAESALRYLRTHSPYKLCFLEDFVCCLVGQNNKESWQKWRSHIGYWILLDWYLHELECPCWSCRPDEGVAIARVLLRRVSLRGTLQCKVMLIETGGVFRRALRKDACRPFLHGAIDLVPYLWQPLEHVTRDLRAQGVELISIPGDPAIVHERLDLRAIKPEQLNRGVLRAHVLEDPVLGIPRIAAFDVPD